MEKIFQVQKIDVKIKDFSYFSTLVANVNTELPYPEYAQTYTKVYNGDTVVMTNYILFVIHSTENIEKHKLPNVELISDTTGLSFATTLFYPITVQELFKENSPLHIIENYIIADTDLTFEMLESYCNKPFTVFAETNSVIPDVCDSAINAQICFDDDEEMYTVILRGDIDKDGEITVNDISALRNLIMCQEYDVRGDANLDGKVDINDIIAIRNYITTESWK